MNRKRSQLQAYFAGVFDGEGFVGGQGKDPNGISVIIGMTEPATIGMLWREYPEARVYVRPNSNKPWRPCYIFRLNYHKAYNFLRDIEPFVITKREQVEVALSLLAHRRRDHQPLRYAKETKRPDEMQCNGRCEKLLNRLKELKYTGSKGVNSVNLGELREYRAKPEDVAKDTLEINEMIKRLWEGVETRDREATPIEPISAPEKEIVQAEAA